jgi:hypothetical protein
MDQFCVFWVQVVGEVHTLAEQAEPKLTYKVGTRCSFACNQPIYCEKLVLHISLATCLFTGEGSQHDIEPWLDKQKTAHHESDLGREVEQAKSRRLGEARFHIGKRSQDLFQY